MLLNIIDELENKLEKFSSDNLKSMLCSHSDVSDKPDLIDDNLSASTSYAFDSELDSIVIKPVIVDTAYHCWKVGHIRPKCLLLKSN
jgi:hypothetical protein